MEGLRVKAFFSIITASATLILLWNIKNINWDTAQIINLLVFGILAVACESLPVALPNGGYVTVSYSIFLSSLILFPLGVTLIIIAASCLLLFGRASTEQPLYKRIFNASQYILAFSTAYGVICFSKSLAIEFDLGSISFYVMAAIVYMIVNMSIVAVILGLTSGKSPWSIWLVNIRWALPNFLALVPLGFLLALLYKNWGPLGLFLLFIPLLISRHSFQLYIDMRDNYLNTIEALVQALEAKDPYTSGHSARVATFAVAIADGIKMSEEKVEFLKYAAVLHDVGKIGVSEVILNKEGKLIDVEWESIRSHPVTGQTIIKGIKFLFDIGQVVRHHHERVDGKGYPDGIRGEEIPLESRIIAVADTYDAITSDRSYRKGSSHDEAIAELKRVAGTQLDPELVEVFCRVVTIEVAQRVSSEQRLQIVNVRGEVCS